MKTYNTYIIRDFGFERLNIGLYHFVKFYNDYVYYIMPSGPIGFFNFDENSKLLEKPEGRWSLLITHYSTINYDFENIQRIRKNYNFEYFFGDENELRKYLNKIFRGDKIQRVKKMLDKY